MKSIVVWVHARYHLPSPSPLLCLWMHTCSINCFISSKYELMNSFCVFFHIFSIVSTIDSAFVATHSVCDETNTPKSYRYHPGLWSGKKWLCCKTINRTAFGCQAATHWSETNNNPTSSKYHFISFRSLSVSHCLYALLNRTEDTDRERFFSFVLSSCVRTSEPRLNAHNTLSLNISLPWTSSPSRNSMNDGAEQRMPKK